jgi:hypothetical protein
VCASAAPRATANASKACAPSDISFRTAVHLLDLIYAGQVGFGGLPPEMTQGPTGEGGLVGP